MKRRKGEALGDGEGFKNVYYRTIMTTKKERKKVDKCGGGAYWWI